jgi:hypothetical protein
MFCPGCGIKEDHPVQFCRACGTDLRVVRLSLEQGDLTIASAAAAREEVIRAVATKIKEAKNLNHLEEVLPELEKFLESPQERRLRRLRTGVITAAVGLGVTLFFFLLSLALAAETNLFFLSGLGVLTFLTGLGIIINGVAFTVPKQNMAARSTDELQQEALDLSSSSVAEGQDRTLPASRAFSSFSVTEHTTQHLSDELIKPPSK